MTVAERFDVAHERRGAERAAQRHERTAFRREQRETFEELVPRADAGTFAARQEKAAGRREARAAAEGDAQGLDTAGVDVMGGAQDSFAAAMGARARKEGRRAAREGARREHAQGLLAAHRAKEEDTMAQMRALATGAAARGIAPRAPPPS